MISTRRRIRADSFHLLLNVLAKEKRSGGKQIEAGNTGDVCRSATYIGQTVAWTHGRHDSYATAADR